MLRTLWFLNDMVYSLWWVLRWTSMDSSNMNRFSYRIWSSSLFICAITITLFYKFRGWWHSVMCYLFLNRWHRFSLFFTQNYMVFENFVFWTSATTSMNLAKRVKTVYDIWKIQTRHRDFIRFYKWNRNDLLIWFIMRNAARYCLVTAVAHAQTQIFKLNWKWNSNCEHDPVLDVFVCVLIRICGRGRQRWKLEEDKKKKNQQL